MKKNRLLIRFLFGNTMLILLCIGLNMISGYNKSIGAMYIQRITDTIESGNIGQILEFVLIGGILTFSSYVMRWLGAVVPEYLAEKFSFKMRIRLYEHLCRIPFIEYEKSPFGEYHSLIENDTARAGQMVYIMLSRVLNNLFIFGFSIWVMMKTNLRDTVVIVMSVFMATAINQFILRFIKHYEGDAQQSLANMTHALRSSFYGVEVIKAFAVKDYAADGYLKVQKEYCTFRLKAGIVNALRTLWYSIVENGCLYGSIIYLGILGLRGEMSIGSVLMFIYLIKQIIMPIEVIFRWMSTFIGASASWKRVNKLLEQESTSPIEKNSDSKEYEEHRELSRFKKKDNQDGQLSIIAKHITFSYDEKEPIIDNMDIQLEAGKVVGLKGKSGAGKTTLLKILMGIYHSDTAKYLLKGELCENLYGVAAYGALENSLFPMSIYENIALGNPKVTQVEVRNQLETMGFGDWICTLPNGLDTVLQNNVSGGQAQAISTARAMISDRPFVILDEPFSALDAEKEERLIELLRHESEQRVILFTSHREDIFEKLEAECLQL